MIRVRTMVVLGVVILAIAASVLLYAHRADRCVLYYYGASPEVPQGRAIAILNPFRDRKDESNAEWLIRDLRTSQCERIVQERLQADPSRICQVVRGTNRASLIWLDQPPDFQARSPSRQLIYDLPETHARLVIYFSRDEDGWGVSSASIAQ